MNSPQDFEEMVKRCNENEARLRDGESGLQTQENSCDYCNNPILFAMQDNYHQFSMGLITILQCLKLAEDEGHVPKLPGDWWVQLANRYNLEL
ncbi:MAG: hypothetical protein IJD04_04445 [Desulfovibrionaceae bacterium]|nr:hypothetical protein [Desulfovibrionaceae bacterium]